MLSFPSSVVSPPSVSTPKMVMADGVPPLVETCVLLPEEFALKVEAPTPRMPPSLLNLLPHLATGVPGQSHLPSPLLERLAPSLSTISSPLTSLSPGLSPLGMSLGGPSSAEDCIKVCAIRRLPAHTRYLPFSGTVRADKLPHLPCLPPMDPRQRYGSYDEVCERATGRVRLCNWVRFVGYSLHFTPQVNMVASRVRGSVVFEVVRDVVPGERLVAFLLPDMSSDDTFLLPALTFLRSSLYRQTIDSIMAEAPLDLSRSLLTSPSSPSSLESVRVPSGHLKRKPDHSPVRSPSPVPSSPTPIPSPKNNIPQFPTVPSSFFPLRHPPVGMGLRDLDLNLSRMPSLPLNLTPPTSSGNSSTASLGVRTPKTSDLPVSTHSETPLSLGPPKRRERTMLPCSECGKAFDRPSLLKRHMRTHTGEKPHVCDVCGKGFSTSSSLNTHRRIHSGEKPHQCGVCGKRFTASSNLYYHKMTHVKEKPHKCSLCTRSFPTPGDLRSHMFVHNGQWPHKCTICGKGFSKLTNLRNHALLHAEMKRTERQLTSLPSSLTSPAASTSGSDTPLTPPAAYTPPTYSTFNRSTSQNSPTSGIPPSPSISHLSQSPPSSPSESIILSSSSSPSSPAPAEEKDRLQPLATSHSNADQEVDRCLPDSTNDDVKKLTTAEKLASDIHEEKHYIENEKKTETEGESKSSAETCSLPVTSQPLTTNTSAVSSSAVPSSHRESAPPKLSFSLDALLGSSKKEDAKVQNDRDSCTSKEDSRVIQHTKLMDNQIQAERSENPKADEQTTER